MKTVQSVGVLLVVVSAIGFLTIADDVRHIGELVGVGAIGVVGIALVSAAYLCRRAERSRSDDAWSRPAADDGAPGVRTQVAAESCRRGPA